jgi:hypothetical protein
VLEKVNHRLPLDYGTAELLRLTWWYDDSKGAAFGSGDRLSLGGNLC